MRIKLATPLIGEFPCYANVKLPDSLDSPIKNRPKAAIVMFNTLLVLNV
jgi:hypothetical protein